MMPICFHFLTIFPELIEPYFSASILQKAKEKGLVSFFAHDLRNYAIDKHHRVDDSPYGGGAGMVMKPDVLVAAVRDLKAVHSIERVVLLSPRGVLFSDPSARKLASVSSVLFICGRYEGVDERVMDMVVDEEISIGDYVVTGGELPALVIADAVARFLPGVLGAEDSPQDESHANGLLEYPHYTRPPVFEGKGVPEVLLSGNHEAIRRWREEESLKITRERRPELLEKRKN